METEELGMQNEIEVLIVDDHPVMAMGVERLVSSQPNYRVVATLNAGAEYFRRPELVWDVAIIDLNLSDGSGLALLDDVRERHPERHVVIYSVAPPEQMGVVSMARGASAYVCKHDDPRMLLTALEHAASGRRFVSPALAEMLLSRGNGRAALTTREVEMLQLLASGERPSAIADLLGITRATVSGHLSSARKKLGARSNVELVRLFEQRS